MYIKLMSKDIIKIVQVKSRDRIVIPKEVRDALKLKEGDFVAFLRDPPGVRIRKTVFKLKEE